MSHADSGVVRLMLKVVSVCVGLVDAVTLSELESSFNAFGIVKHHLASAWHDLQAIRLRRVLTGPWH